jgi:hypothetical protein
MLSTMKIKSLFAAMTLAIGLQGALLWQMNEVASTGAQRSAQAARAGAAASASATVLPTQEFTLAPVTIVARRLTDLPMSNLASAEKTEAPLSPVCVRIAGDTTSVEKDGRSCG